MSFFGVIEQLVLICNAMAIVNEERILKKCGINRQLARPEFGPGRIFIAGDPQATNHIWSLYHEELWPIYFDCRQRTDGVPQDTLRMNK